MRLPNWLRPAFAVVALLVATAPAKSDEVNAAVAANFTAAMNRLVPEFERATGHKVVASFGATGKLYAQIKNGAPFDVLLAADDEHPKKLAQENLAVAATRFTYATGRLVLWSAKPAIVDDRGTVLHNGEFAHLAIANPKTAPYGSAAEQVMRKLGVWTRIEPRLVQGENIAQTFQFISTGNASLGFVALAQIRALPPAEVGSYWLVPTELHDPLRQDAILLKRARDKTAARAFLAFLRSPAVKAIITELGYLAS